MCTALLEKGFAIRCGVMSLASCSLDDLLVFQLILIILLATDTHCADMLVSLHNIIVISITLHGIIKLAK